MTESKVMQHTPGPWEAKWSVEGDFYGIYPATRKMEFPVAKMPDYVKAEINQANANLIASAPDLLSAARAFLEPYKELSDEQLIGIINGADESCCTLAPHIAAHVRAFRKIIEQADPRNPKLAGRQG